MRRKKTKRKKVPGNYTPGKKTERFWKKDPIILEGWKKAPRGRKNVPTIFGGGRKKPAKRKKDPHVFSAIGKKPPYNNFPVTFHIFLLLPIFRWTLYFSWYFPYFPLCCHISLSLISSPQFQYFCFIQNCRPMIFSSVC